MEVSRYLLIVSPETADTGRFCPASRTHFSHELHNSRLPPTCHQSACHKFRQSLFKMKYHQFSKWLHKKNKKKQTTNTSPVVGWQYFTCTLQLQIGPFWGKFNISDCPCLFAAWWLIVVILPGVFMLRRLNLSISLSRCQSYPSSAVLWSDGVCVCWRVCFPFLTDALSERPSWVYSSLWMRV